MIEAARAFAIAAHGDQIYGDDQPYEHHLAEVAAVLGGWTDDPELVAAAWLHDTLEDTPVSRSELETRFGARIARIVWAVTAEGDTRPEKMAAIYRKIAETPDAALVKLADRVANVEAAAPGSRHIARYSGEQPAFEAAVKGLVPSVAWARLEEAYPPRLD
ncbi:MAG: HD domain-containing protein [Brevundimonas sp.]|uniref:HD domain-containing protein n=1 Tax=Brevundimonas sp. TaxID=1871086 RepID=UPI0040342975